jgi:diguanylate cyclase (GGDEF)-like protein
MQILSPIFSHIHHFLSRQDRKFIIIIVSISIAFLGWLDYLSGSEITLSFFYLIPIFIATWYSDLKTGFTFTGISILTWVISNGMAGEKFSYETIRYWNAFVRFVFFSFNVFLLDSLKKALIEEQLLAFTDSLTGAYNRRAFYRLAEMEMLRSRRYSHPFTIAYFDLDDFKTVNDHYGHQGGDTVLRDFIKILQTNTRDTDLLARLGGDEFVIILPETDGAGAKKAIHKLQLVLSKEWVLEKEILSVSVGVVTYKSPPKTVDKLLLPADRAMYKAKSLGKNQAVFVLADYEQELEKR